MRRENFFTLPELAALVGVLALALAMFRGAALLASQRWDYDEPLLAGALAMAASFLTGAVAGNGVAVLAVGREHALDGLIIGGAVLTLPLLAIFVRLVDSAAF